MLLRFCHLSACSTSLVESHNYGVIRFLEPNVHYDATLLASTSSLPSSSPPFHTSPVSSTQTEPLSPPPAPTYPPDPLTNELCEGFLNDPLGYSGSLFQDSLNIWAANSISANDEPVLWAEKFLAEQDEKLDLSK